MYSSYFLKCNVTAQNRKFLWWWRSWPVILVYQSSLVGGYQCFWEEHACFIFRVKVTIETAGSPTPLVTTTRTTQHHHSEIVINGFPGKNSQEYKLIQSKLITSRNFFSYIPTSNHVCYTSLTSQIQMKTNMAPNPWLAICSLKPCIVCRTLYFSSQWMHWSYKMTKQFSENSLYKLIFSLPHCNNN